MKKTEAISILATSVRPREPKDRARYDEAVGMAIEALKCSETPKSSDCISRQAAIEALKLKDRYDGIIISSFSGIEKVIKALPSAQPEIIRCKDCKHRYLDGMIWNCPFGLPGGEDFFCAYGAIGGGDLE